VSGQLQAQAALTPDQKAPDTHRIGDWMGPTTGLDAVAKEKNHWSCRELNRCRAARNLITTLKELPRLIIKVYASNKLHQV